MLIFDVAVADTVPAFVPTPPTATPPVPPNRTKVPVLMPPFAATPEKPFRVMLPVDDKAVLAKLMLLLVEVRLMLAAEIVAVAPSVSAFDAVTETVPDNAVAVVAAPKLTLPLPAVREMLFRAVMVAPEFCVIAPC